MDIGRQINPKSSAVKMVNKYMTTYANSVNTYQDTCMVRMYIDTELTERIYKDTDA